MPRAHGGRIGDGTRVPTLRAGPLNGLAGGLRQGSGAIAPRHAPRDMAEPLSRTIAVPRHLRATSGLSIGSGAAPGAPRCAFRHPRRRACTQETCRPVLEQPTPISHRRAQANSGRSSLPSFQQPAQGCPRQAAMTPACRTSEGVLLRAGGERTRRTTGPPMPPSEVR
jgi:hypothetical protein